MKNITKLIVIILAIAMLCPVIASCTSDGEGSTTTTTPQQNVTEDPNGSGAVTDDPDAPELDADGYEKDDLWQYNLNYDGKKVQVLHWNSEENEFDIEATTGSKVDDAIYERNLAIESRLGVELFFTEQEGSAGKVSNFLQHVEANRETYDIIATYSRTAGTLSIRGLYANLYNIENSYLNFEQPWWPETLLDTVTIGDALYFCSGDASTNVIHFMYTIYFNKDLKDTYTDITEDFYELVESNQWTIDKLIGLTEGRYENTNTANPDGANFDKSDLEDTYGFCTIDYGVDAFYTGSGLTLVTQDDEKMLRVHEDYTSLKAIDLVDKLQDWLTGPDCVVFRSSGQYRAPFVNGRALFCQERAYLAKRYLTDATFKYGILPTPLYNNKQNDYRSIVGNPFTLYGIAIDCKDKQAMTAVIECWGSEGYRKTTPALFYETMQARYADAPEDAKMWDLIKRTACFDIGRLLDKSELNYYMSEEPSNAACSTSGSWSRSSKMIASAIEKKLETIVESYRKNQEND